MSLQQSKGIGDPGHNLPEGKVLKLRSFRDEMSSFDCKTVAL
jgi:hypothetical protein